MNLMVLRGLMTNTHGVQNADQWEELVKLRDNKSIVFNYAKGESEFCRKQVVMK